MIMIYSTLQIKGLNKKMTELNVLAEFTALMNINTFLILDFIMIVLLKKEKEWI